MQAVQRHEGFWCNPENGRRLFYRLWKPSSARSLLVIVHGFGEHSGRYDALAQAFAERDVAVACPDLWGHGRSGGRRGDIAWFNQYLDDLEAIATGVFVAWANTSGFAVMGHSFGGLLATHWALRRPESLRCLVLQSPLLGVGFPIPRWKERLTEVLRRFWKQLALPTGLDPVWLSHDPAIIQSYKQDPLVHRRMSVRCYSALLDAMRQAVEQAGCVARPTLLLYGTSDRVISLEACQAFFAALACQKRIVSFSDCYHELHHEPSRPKVIEEIVGWVKAHA